MFGLLALVVLVRGAPQLLQQKPTVTPVGSVHEHVMVERIVITGRVIDRFAIAIPGLSTADFRLRVDGKDAAIESVDWVAPQSQRPQAPPAISAETANRDLPKVKAEIPGPATLMSSTRTVVMLFQWEIAGQKDAGVVRMMRQAERMIESSTPDERIAVLAFGSSLRLVQDFTNDRVALRDAVEGIRGWNFHGRPAATAGPSFATAIAGCGSRDSIRKALVCVGSALQTLPGPKTLLFFGWSIGRPKRDSWFLEYPAMIEAISKARTSVFVLDVSGGHHSLEPSLKLLAADTGGLFNGGCIYQMEFCADLARMKTERAIGGGTYELVFRDPATKRGWHEVEVQPVRGNGIAAFQQWYRD